MPDPVTIARIEAEALAFLTATPPRFGTLATINPDGTPHQAVVWYAIRDDGTVLLNSRVGRRWPTNLLRDPRCSMAVEAGMDWVTVRGDAVPLHDPEAAYRDIAALAELYEGHEPDKMPARLAGFRRDHRITFHLVPRGVTVHL